jgi:hypothetical protein
VGAADRSTLDAVPFLVPRRRAERLLAAALAAQLATGVSAAVLLQPGRGAAEPAAPTRAVNGRAEAPSRTTAVRALLAHRAAAVLRGDRPAFLATVDPVETAFRVRQARLFDALRAVPMASWRYEVHPERERPRTAALDARRGTWWAPDVTLRYAIRGFDRTATTQRQGLTFRQRGQHWYLTADDDFAATAHATARDLWDGGPVVALRGPRCLVLAHPQTARLARTVVAECESAVPRVTAVWGRSWSQRVVVMVPASTAELNRMVPGAGDLSQIAAVATAELVGPASSYHPVGDRVLVNSLTFVQLGSVGRRVVLTHEVTHVASRAATGPQVPTWFVEGLADYVGYLGVPVPLAVAAEELQADVRRGRLPRVLPGDGAFDGSRPDLAQTYEQSWLAVTLLARTYGQERMLRLYRDTGADRSRGALERAMRADLRITVRDFTAQWRADLRRRLS